MFEEYLNKWELVPDGEAITTHSSRLLPVRQQGVAAMIKIAVEAEEKFGGVLMSWWDGKGAAKVLAQEGDAILLERAQGTRSLEYMARNGEDDEATRILCGAVARLHAPRDQPLPYLIPLTEWFRELEPMAEKYGGILSLCAATARELLASPQDSVVLHGDIHHGNILDFGERGWLAIDPKRLTGERGFDYANIFCNPDATVALAPGRLVRRVDIVCEIAGLDRKRLLQWILAWSGLSAAWWLGDGIEAKADLTVSELAAAELEKY